LSYLSSKITLSLLSEADLLGASRVS